MLNLWTAYKNRIIRRHLLYRALRKRRQLASLQDRTDLIAEDAVLTFSTVRNEIIRLPHFLEHYRSLGVHHFLIVDNGSDDGTAEYLAAQPDVSLWHTTHSYKKSRFGVDWLTWLQIKYGHGHWCLTVDADEILIYPHHDTRSLSQLTKELDQAEKQSYGAMMLDMYPKGGLDARPYVAGQNPFEILRWFDADNYHGQMQEDLQNLWIQGGVRERVFFADKPERAPTLNKTPLVKWSRRFAYVNSTHSLLPRRLNQVFDSNGAGENTAVTTGVLLHSKFLHIVASKSVEEKQRQEHFANSNLYDAYYDSLAQSPDLWNETSTEYTNWQQLESLGMFCGRGWR